MVSEKTNISSFVLLVYYFYFLTHLSWSSTYHPSNCAKLFLCVKMRLLILQSRHSIKFVNCEFLLWHVTHNVWVSKGFEKYLCSIKKKYPPKKQLFSKNILLLCFKRNVLGIFGEEKILPPWGGGGVKKHWRAYLVKHFHAYWAWVTEQK